MIETHICEYCENVYPINFDYPYPSKIFSRRISRSGTGQNTVSYRPDPFDEEIRNDFTNHWLCDDCYYASRMEI